MVLSIPMPSKQQGPKLPYDPFTFSLFLVPITIEPPASLETSFEILPDAPRIVGKANRDIVLPYPTVSRDHCRFENNCIQDLGSTTGTYIWMTASYKHKLADGEEFVVGSKQRVLQIGSLQKRKL